MLPTASPVVKSPNTRKGCAAAWYLTSLAMGSGIKNLCEEARDLVSMRRVMKKKQSVCL